MNKTETTVSTFNKMAQFYLDKFGEMPDYAESFDAFCTAIKKSQAKVLELACGPGNITAYLLKKRPDFDVLATDLADNMLELGKKNVPKAKFLKLDCRYFLQLNSKFDAIFCGFGLPYLNQDEVEELIKDAAHCLNENGILYLSTMEDDYSKSGPKGPSSGGPDITYTYYHQGTFICKALNHNGFEIIYEDRKKYDNQHGEITTDLFLISKKSALKEN